MQQLRPSLKTQPQAVKAILMASVHTKANNKLDAHRGCRWGGTIGAPSANHGFAIKNGNKVNSSTNRAFLEINALDLISGTPIKANEIYGIEVVTLGANRNRQVHISVNGFFSPMFHSASPTNPPTAAHDYRIFVTRAEEQKLTFMNKYGPNPNPTSSDPTSASNVITLTPFVTWSTPGVNDKFEIIISSTQNDPLDVAVITSISLLDINGQKLGTSTYATKNNDTGIWSLQNGTNPLSGINTWGKFRSEIKSCICPSEKIEQGLTERQGAGVMNPYVALAITAANNYEVSTIKNVDTTNSHTFEKSRGGSTGLNVSLAWLRTTHHPAPNTYSHYYQTPQNLNLFLKLNNTWVGSSVQTNSSTEMIYFSNKSNHWNNLNEFWSNHSGWVNRNFTVDVHKASGVNTWNTRYAIAWSVDNESAKRVSPKTTGPISTITSSPSFGTYEPWMAFNQNLTNEDNPTDCWHSSLNSFNTSTGYSINNDGVWLQIDMGTATRVDAYSVHNRISTSSTSVNNNYAPRDFVFEGSATGVAGSWIPLSTIIDRPKGNVRDITTHTINNPAAYRYYRLRITRSHVSNGYGPVTIGQLELWQLY
jgi:hypothetical protein